MTHGRRQALTRPTVNACPVGESESRRLAALQRFAVIDTPREEMFERITHMAATLFDTPIALLTLVDARRVWFKASVGLDAVETPRGQAFCDVTIATDGVLVVKDARKDARFCDKPLVAWDPKIRFYAGVALLAPDRSKVGTLCVMDRRTRSFDATQRQLLEQLAQLATTHLELRLELLGATAAKNQLRAVIDASPDPIVTCDLDGRVTSWSRAAARTFGWEEREVLGQLAPYVPPEEIPETAHLRTRVLEHGESVHDFPSVRLRRDGTRVEVAISSAPIVDREGIVSGAVCVVDDVTSMRRVQQIERHRFEVLELAANDAPLAQIFERLVSSVEYSIPGASATIMLLRGDRLEQAAASAKIPPGFLAAIEGVMIGPDVGSCGTAAFTGKTVIVSDIAVDPLWRDYREVAALHGLAACWSTPISNGHGRVLGTLAFYFYDARLPRGEDLRFAHEAAHVASIAIEGHDARAKLEELALHDVLTGLPNRSLFEDRLGQAIAEAKRSGKRLALGLLDLDRFKLVNDNLGHAVGDQLLREVGNRLQRSLRPQDTIARMGGDEFLLLIADVDDRATVRHVADRFLSNLEQHFAPGGHEVFVRGSMGLSLYPDDAVESTQLLRLADRAMYEAKAHGDCARFYAEIDRTDGDGRLALETSLNRALENGELELAYQPEVSVATGEVVACEALLRWNHPELGSMMPDRFIAIAEETGLIISIGAWVLGEACRFARRWASAGGPGVVAVNVSARQFEDRHFVRNVLSAVHDAGIEPGQLRLEITESLIMRSPETAAATLRELRDAGVRGAIDDFGTGYSSLNYLKRFPIDGLKIDRVFLREIVGDAGSKNDEAIIRAILSVGRALSLNVVAEGVETTAQLDFLRANGCDLAQGYLFARPLDADAMVRWQPA